MAQRNVIVELNTPAPVARGPVSFAAAALDMAAPLPGFAMDPTFGVVRLPSVVPTMAEPATAFDVDEGMAINDSPQASTYLVRGTLADESQAEALRREPNVREVYADPTVEVCAPLCPGSPALGNEATVARLLGVPELTRARMTGRGVLVAIVDTGLNMAYLNSRGHTPNFDRARSWNPPGVAGLPNPGEHAVDHGTMCAFDATIAAPQCTLLDIALLQSRRPGSSIMEGLLSDAVLAYRHLLDVMNAQRRPGEMRAMVVNNSWGMFHPSWDFPVGSPGNYSHNPNHPFSRIVTTLERAGADILFAAGNCGRDCPDGRCQGNVTQGITGANGHPRVLSVAGVDVTKRRVGYSTSGPGRLSRLKPDVSGYTHFDGSGVYAADGGTSAATPVVAGVVAAFRSRFPYSQANFASYPAAVRTLVRHTAEDRGLIGFDFDYGFGIINGRRIASLTSLSVMEPVEMSMGEPVELEASAAEPDEVPERRRAAGA